jgi:hypothetical protein
MIPNHSAEKLFCLNNFPAAGLRASCPTDEKAANGFGFETVGRFFIRWTLLLV